MAEDASYELQQAIVRRLKADNAVKALIAARIYDRVPAKDGKVIATFPYLSFGPEQEIPDDAECIPGSEFFMQLDAWSRAVGFREVKKIARAVEDALISEDGIELGDNALVTFEYDGRVILRDSDGITSHAAISFRALIEKRR